MDPLSDVLALLKPQSYVSAGFDAGGDWSIRFSNQQNRMKCYAVLSGECWLSVEDVAEPVRLRSGECFVLPSGRDFRLASDVALPPVESGAFFPPARPGGVVTVKGGGDFYLVGCRFAVSGRNSGSNSLRRLSRRFWPTSESSMFSVGCQARRASRLM